MEQIKIIDDCLASETEWQEVCDQCPYATYFHTPEWARVFSAYMQGRMRPWPRKIVFEDGKIAIIPLSRISYFNGIAQAVCVFSRRDLRGMVVPSGTFPRAMYGSLFCICKIIKTSPGVKTLMIPGLRDH
jgi:hypothetical protein